MAFVGYRLRVYNPASEVLNEVWASIIRHQGVDLAGSGPRARHNACYLPSGLSNSASATGDRRRGAPLEGTRLGRYRIGARLGAGGAASVYLARLEGPHNFGRLVALKVIHEHLLDESEFVDMFLDEANLAVRLAYPNVVHVYDLGREGHVLFLAMEYLDGQPLSRVIARARQQERALPLDLVAWIGARAAEGLHHAHELCDHTGQRIGVVHRDVSPHNLFVTYDGQVKLIDFGIARAEGRLAHTALGQVKGKFAYMAPEQALYGNYDHRADVFALGVTLYEAAVGSRLFPDLDRVEALHKIVLGDIPDPRQRRPDFPDALAAILMQALEGDPNRRLQSAAELARRLDAFTHSLEMVGERPARLGRLLRDCFEQERREAASAVAELRAETTPHDFVDQTGFGVSSSAEPKTIPPSAKRRFPLWATLIPLAGLAVGVAVTYAQYDGASPPPATAASAASVTLELRLQPEAAALITANGRVVIERPALIALPRASKAVPIAVHAPGYDPVELSVVPNRDQLLVVPLMKTLESPATAASSVAPPQPSSDPPKARRRAPDKSGSPLILDYPF